MKGQLVLKNDINRGVTTIKDKNYHEMGGGTRFSLMFFDKVKHLLTDTYKAELLFDNKHWYRLRISTKSGLTVSFHGCSFGYGGEGSRGSYQILSNLGFSEKQCRKVFEHRDHMSGSDKLLLFKRK